MQKKSAKSSAASKSQLCKIKPLGDRVLIEEIEEKESRTLGGIILPDSVSSEKDSKKGKVIAVGEGRVTNDGKLIKPPVKAGDKVLYSWGDNVKIDGREYTLVSSDNVTAILE